MTAVFFNSRFGRGEDHAHLFIVHSANKWKMQQQGETRLIGIHPQDTIGRATRDDAPPYT